MAYSACIRCHTCDGFPCLVHAKSDAEVVAVRPALEFPNVTLLRNAKALKLKTNAAGTAVTEVIAVASRGTRRLPRRHRRRVCGAANTAKLLLMSANDKHPNGLANGSDQVGGTTCSTTARPCWRSPAEPNRTMFQKTMSLNDFYFGMDGFEFPMGNIQMIGKSLGPMYRGEKPLETALAPTAHSTTGASRCRFLADDGGPARSQNRVSVDRDRQVILNYTPNNQVPKQKLYEKLQIDAAAIWACIRDHLIPRNIYMKTDIPLAGCAHQAGTCRFGTDPKTSVLDLNCKAHELDNLYVVDTSFFVSIGAVNPSLTAIANAIRVGDHLLQRLA